jgi:hypothetical protein
MKAFGEADQKYAQMIAILLGSLKKPSE